MDSPENIPLEEALARGLIACSTCGAKGPGVRRVESRFACERCATKHGGAAPWIVGAVGLLLLAGAAWLLRPAPPAPDPLILAVDALLKQGRFAEARERLTARIAEAPADPGLRIYLGHALFNLGHVEDALAEFRKAMELDPEAARLGEVWVGICLQRLGYAAEALPILQKPVIAEALDERRRVALAEALLDLERYDDALALLPAGARDPRTLFNRHRALRYGGKAAEAEKLLASLDPEQAWTFRVTQLREDGDFDGARRLIAERKPASPAEAGRIARAVLTLAVESGGLARVEVVAAEQADVPEAVWFRAVGALLAGRRADAEKAAADFLAKADPKAASLRQFVLTMRLLLGKAKADELEAEAKRLPRFQSADLYFFLALATGEKAWAAKGLEATPGRNFPYHALQRLAGR
jgi:tetratricopeptide (TPR) repeat protein